MREVEVPTRFAHDLTRIGRRVFVLSTESGEIIEMLLQPDSYPQTMTLVKIHSVFTKQQSQKASDKSDTKNLERRKR